MAHYDIFRHHLLMKFPAYGHALWEPDPGNLYPAVEVGDVGWVYQGKFRRLFNVFLPEDDPSHRNFGVPEYHEQLTLNIENHIETGRLNAHNFCSTTVKNSESDRWADGSTTECEVTFSCPRNQGAVLCLPIEAQGKDTVARADFGKWIIRHIDRWFPWARGLGLEINCMEDIILVTGTHRTKSWTNVAFPGGQKDAQASFGVNLNRRRGDIVRLNWQISHERIRGALLNRGPDGEDLRQQPEDQCIFIRGFRATRRFKILPPKLKGAAGPNPDSKGSDEEPDAELMPIPAVPEYRDPLHILLKYTAKEAPPKCDMVLVHDDDLAPLHGIYDNAPLDCLQSDVVLSHIRNIKPTVHCAQIDLSSAPKSGTDIESTWVATLSNIFEKRNSSSFGNVPDYGVGTEGYTRSYAPSQQAQAQFGRLRPPPPPPQRNFPAQPAYPNLNALSQQAQSQVGHPRPPPPPPPRNFPAPPSYPNLNYNQVPRSLVTYQSGTRHDKRPPSLFPEAFPEVFPQDAFPPRFPVTQAHAHARTPARAPEPANYGFAVPGRSGSHQPPVQSSGEYEFARSPGPQAHISLPRASRSSPTSAPPQQLYPVGSQTHRPHPPVTPAAQPQQLHPAGSHRAHQPHPLVSLAAQAQQPYHAGSHQAYQPHPPASLAAQPQQLYNVGNQQAHQPHLPVSQPHPPRVGQKKAVVVGINYSTHRDRRLKLEWGVIDAREMARFLQEHLGFHAHDIRILTDDKHDKRENRPTEKNIVAAMRWLVEGAQSGDYLFFYFSGHAIQVEDKDRDEPDGFDECVCAMDYDSRKDPPTGIIIDDTMHNIMVKHLPKGCRLTAIFDYCHSGTLLDLPYIYDSHGRVKQNRPDIVQRKASDADVITLSACKDTGEAFEAGGGGALRRAFIEYAKTWGNGGTYLEAIGSLRTYMAANSYVQQLQLSSSHWIDTDQRFIIAG